MVNLDSQERERLHWLKRKGDMMKINNAQDIAIIRVALKRLARSKGIAVNKMASTQSILDKIAGRKRR